MSFRNHGGGHFWKQMIRGFGSFSTRPQLQRTYATSSSAHLHDGDVPKKTNKMWKGEHAPVFVALGLIIMSTSLGLHTAMQQLGRAPNVSIRKSRRETIPEVTEPERVLQDSHQFLRKSFFRKVAHVQADFHQPQHNNSLNLNDPIRTDPLPKPSNVPLPSSTTT